MYLADYHTHSRVSPDSQASILDLAAAAAEAGMDEICVTDHFEPYEVRSVIPRKTFNWAAAPAEYAAAAAQWDGPVKLRLGLELGDATQDISHSEQLLTGMPDFDFIIGSVHMLSEKFGRQDMAWIRELDENTCYAEVEDYLKQALSMAQWGKFDVLGHLTLPLRYMNERRGFHITMDPYGDAIEAVLRALIANGCGIEINTNRGSSPLPGEKWLKRYRALGGEIITLGSDAHRPSDVGKGIMEGQELLRACGFKRFCTFEKRSPIWHEL